MKRITKYSKIQYNIKYSIEEKMEERKRENYYVIYVGEKNNNI